MKKLIFGFLGVILLCATSAFAQPLGFQNFKNMIFIGTPCATFTPPTAAPYNTAICLDSTTLTITVLSAGKFVAPANTTGIIHWTDTLGAFGNTAVMPVTAPCAGHFTQLNCTATLTGSCTTGPTINVTDITATTTGTAVSPTTTVATIAAHSETLTFAAADTIGMAQTASTGTCTTPHYACTANYTCP